MNRIKVYNKENKPKEMEVVSEFKLDNYSHNYIIYKELDNTHSFVAKYNGEEILDLDTNLSEEELALCNQAFKKNQYSSCRSSSKCFNF